MGGKVKGEGDKVELQSGCGVLTAWARQRGAGLPSCECASAEWHWGEMTCVRSAAPLVADGFSARSPEPLLCGPGSLAYIKKKEKKKTLGVFSFTDFSLPRACMRPVTVTQSRRLGTISLQAWPILPPPPTHAHVRALPAPWRGQGQMSRGLYSLRFCRLNQVGWVSSSLPFNGMVIWFFLLMPAATLSSCLGLSPSSASSSVFITVVLWLNYGLWSGSTQPYISPPCCPVRARLASAALPLPAACPVTSDHRGGPQKGAKGKKTNPGIMADSADE